MTRITTRKAVHSGIRTGLLVAIALSAAAAFSLNEDGVQVEAAGMQMTVKTSFEKGLQIYFLAPD